MFFIDLPYKPYAQNLFSRSEVTCRPGKPFLYNVIANFPKGTLET